MQRYVVTRLCNNTSPGANDSAPGFPIYYREEILQLATSARKRLFSLLYQTFCNVSAQGTRFAGSVVTIVTVLWNCYAQFLSSSSFNC